MRKVFYSTQKKSTTDIYIGKNIIEDTIAEISSKFIQSPEKVLIIFDEAFPEGFKSRVFEGFEVYFGVVEAESVFGGEEVKSLESLERLVNLLQDYKIKRTDCLVICGGGALSDACGFLASVYMRGLRMVIFPTTFLSMIDASVGGKNAINFRGVKNLIGTFYHPDAIVDEISFLETLPERELLSGVGEVVKTAILDGGKLYQEIRQAYMKNIISSENIEEIIYLCVKFKAEVVEKDPFETKGVREILNFGHTLGHAIESLNLGRITHGEAVLAGIILEEWLAKDAGLVSQEIYSSIENMVFLAGLNRKWLVFEPLNLYNYLVFDKKMVSEKEIRLIYVEKPGKPQEFRIDMENLIERLAKFDGG